MKVLVAHNRYQGRGGEDVVFEEEVALLREAGHSVETLTVTNDAIDTFSARVRTTLSTAENREGMRAMGKAVDGFGPDIVHVHNFFPLLSPAVFDICRAKGVPAVVTLHNFRTICAGGMLQREGRVCHKCLRTSNMWGVVHRCYRGSVVGSASSAWMISKHQRRGTWTRPGLRLIALSEFARNIFVQTGFHSDMIDVKPNFLRDVGEPDFTRSRKGMLYVGRLSPEKGVAALVEAASRANFPLRIAGDGPELAALRARATDNVTFLGSISRADVALEMSSAAALVVPSLWYEGFPMVVVEAFSRGTPVIASALGALAEIVSDGVTGLHSPAGNVNTLIECVNRLLGDPAFTSRCGKAARDTFCRLYTPEKNLIQLESIYQKFAETTTKTLLQKA